MEDLEGGLGLEMAYRLPAMALPSAPSLAILWYLAGQAVRVLPQRS